MQYSNVNRRQAYEAAQNGMRTTGLQAVIWFQNRRDGWAWDYTNSKWIPWPKNIVTVKI